MQSEVKRRSTKNQGGTNFDAGIKIAINSAIFRLSREANWRSLRREGFFNTVTSYTTGTGTLSITNNTTNVSAPSATLLTDDVSTGRWVKFSGSGIYYQIRSITSNTAFTIDRVYSGTTSSSLSYEILPQEVYNLPVQCGHRMFLWHTAYGYPYQLDYVVEQDFYKSTVQRIYKAPPTHYHMWQGDMTIKQPKAASVVTISSSSASDTSVSTTVFGTVSGYPDSEIIVTNGSNGTTTASGSKLFTYIERFSKTTSSTTIGRITATTDSANTTVAVIPAGNATTGIQYKKVMLWPLPTAVYPVNVLFYKDPYALVNAGDIHELGEEFDEAIILLATAKLKAEEEIVPGATNFYQLYKDELIVLRRTNVDKIDWFPTLRGKTRNSNRRGDFGGLSFSQVGPYFGPASIQ